jgi:uncharacterized protein (TIGR03437 family)
VDRITGAIDDSRRVALSGNTIARIHSGTDQGPVDPSMDFPYVTLLLSRSAGQQADLKRLLERQQDPSSPSYHAWLNPEQYADRFGVSEADIDKIVGWLGQHLLTVKSVARGRNAIVFGGTASQIESAFGVAIHRYQVRGELHYANTGDPTVPAAFQDVALVIRGLHDFSLKPRLRPAAHPRDTLSDGTHQLAPDDIATIYDITPLYSAGYDGKGQKIAIAGQTDVEISDIENFRSFFGLPANDPTMMLVPGSSDPGISQGDLEEADLDLELSGAVARNATILFVISDLNSGGVINSLQYAIEENLAPVVSISYGDCELDEGQSAGLALQQLAQQANSQGQTVFAASGDSGAADCFGIGDGPAIDNALSVDMPASIPEVTGVGGTEFNEGNGSYWNSVNSANHASALSYIPEMAWNDSAIDGTPSASGGGVSVFFSKPSWQTGIGVPNDGQRDVPDVSLAASPDHDGYQFYSGGSLQIIGGTSAGPPQFAGIAALLNQYLTAKGYQSTAGLGNMNSGLYALAPATGVYHDITVGNNKVAPCTQPCTATAIGYDTTVGYDQVTGLGTPDIYKLVTSWHGSVVSRDSATMTVAPGAASLAFTGNTVLTATVTGAGASPTGEVTFSTGTYSLGAATLGATSPGNATATLTLAGILLAVGANSITAQYVGDSNYFGATATTSIMVTSAAVGPPLITSNNGVLAILNSASYTHGVAPGGIMSIFGSNLASATGGAPLIPLPAMMAGTWVTMNGIAVPLYYVSAAQLNVQVPFEIPANSSATLRIENNGESVFGTVTVGNTAPAIFTVNSQGTGQGAILNQSYQLVDASHPATPGSTYLLIYCIGLGAVSNPPADGAASPGDPPATTGATPQVTVGGVQASVSFSGLAPGFAGLYQVNVLVPASVAAGSAVPVVISVGGVSSNTATIVVQ